MADWTEICEVLNLQGQVLLEVAKKQQFLVKSEIDVRKEETQDFRLELDKRSLRIDELEN